MSYCLRFISRSLRSCFLFASFFSCKPAQNSASSNLSIQFLDESPSDIPSKTPAENEETLQEETKNDDVKLTSKTSSTFTTSTGSSGRNKVTLIANYKLLDIESNDILGSGKISESGDFDIERKRFANYITEEQTIINLTKLIARDVRNMIINDLTK